MAHPLIESFLATGRGIFFNPDNAYGYQCKDLADAYVMHIFPGKSWSETIRPGNANEVFNASNPAYFEKILNNPSDPNLVPLRGDIILWAGDSYNPYGHIAVIESADANGVTVLQQDGYLQCAAFSGRLAYSQAGTGMVQGWLRPKLSTDLAGNQRMVGPANLNQRAEANGGARVVRVITANTVETFTGFVYGAEINTGGVKSNVWYKDDTGYVWAGGFTSQSTAGLPDQTPAPTAAENQRYAGPANINQRAEPNTNSKVVRVITANTLETFTGFVRGEEVSGNNIWYKDNAGYAWSGVFTSQSTAGLPDQTPSPALPVLTENQRLAGPAAINQRKEPNTTSSVVRVIPAKSVEVFTAYVHGENLSGNDIWFKDSTGYAWSGLFESQSVKGMKDETSATSPAPKPADPKPAPVEEPPYEFTPDFDFVEYRPANTWNMQNGNFPAKPAKIVIHQFDSKDKRPSLDGVIGWFQTPRPATPSSAHFAVSGKRIVQMVSLKDRAFHAGTVGNDYIGIEVDPQEDADTIASVKKLIKALNKKYGVKFTYVEHRDVAGNNTECGADIHLENYNVDEADPVVTPVVPPRAAPEPPAPKPKPEIPANPEVTIEMEAKIIAKFLSYTSTDLLKKYLDAHK